MKKQGTLVALLMLSGCWWPLGTDSGSIIFNWIIEGQQYDQNGDEGDQGCFGNGVTEVRAAIAGLSGSFDCDDLLDGGTSGTVDGVPAGPQSYVLTGWGPVYDFDAGESALQALFTGGGSFDLAAGSSNPIPPVMLTAVDTVSGTGDIELLWSFGGQSCAQAGDPPVTVAVSSDSLGEDQGLDGGLVVPCHAQGIDGLRIFGLDGGYGALAALSATVNGVSYAAQPSLYSNGVTESVVQVDLYPLAALLDAGTSTLVLDFSFGPAGGGCTASGVDQLRVRLAESFYDGTFDFFFDTTVPCVDPASLTIAGVDAGGQSFDPYREMVTDDGYDCEATCPLLTGYYLVYAEGLTQGVVSYQRHGSSVWLDGPQGFDGDGLDGGVVETYAIDLSPIGSP